MASTAVEVAILLSAKDAASGVLSNVSTKFNALGTVAKVATAAIAAAGTAVLAAVGTLTALANKSAAAAGEVAKLKRETGLTAEEASKFRVIGERMGLGIDDLSKSFGIFTKNIGTNAAAIVDNHIAVVKAKDGHVDFEKTLEGVAQRFKNMPDGVDKTTLAMELFGKSGKDMIPLLNQGKDGLKAMGDEAARLGLVFDDKALAAAKRYSLAQKDLGENIDGLKNRLGMAFLPVLADVSSAMVRVADNVIPPITAGIEKFSGFVRGAITVVKDLAAMFQGNFQLGAAEGGILKGIIGEQQAAWLNSTIADLAQHFVDFRDKTLLPLFNWLMERAPVVWDAVKTAVSTAWSVVGPIIEGGIEKVKELGQKFEELPPKLKDFVIAAAVAGAVNHTLGDPVGDLIQKFSYLAQGIGGLSELDIPKLVAKIGGPLLAVLGTAGLLGAVTLLALAWSQDWGEIQEKTRVVTDNIGSFLGGVKSAFETQTTKTLPEYGDAYDQVSNRAINPFRTSIEDLTQRVLPAYGDALDDARLKASAHRDEVIRNHEAMAKWEERGQKLGAALKWLGDNVLGPLAEGILKVIGEKFDDIATKVENAIGIIQGAITLVQRISQMKISLPSFGGAGSSYGGGAPQLYVPGTYGGPQAAGGDYLVSKPTLFMAGEAGLERATFTPGGGAAGATNLTINVGTVDSDARVQQLADAVGRVFTQQRRLQGLA